jgi:golgi-specific brefeldin A-resistance guanine nucleotide exchange factor 1
MTFDDFKRNLRGVNDKGDFSVEFLVIYLSLCQICHLFTLQQAIYDSIKKREIVMPEEHVGQLGFDYAWKELLVRSRQTRESSAFFGLVTKYKPRSVNVLPFFRV